MCGDLFGLVSYIIGFVSFVVVVIEYEILVGLADETVCLFTLSAEI